MALSRMSDESSPRVSLAKDSVPGSSRLADAILPALVCGTGVLVIASYFIPALEVVTHVAPQIVTGAVLTSLIVWILRAPRWAIAASMIGAMPPAMLVIPEYAAALQGGVRPAPNTPQLKVITVNLWSHNNDYAGLAQLISTERPDIIVVQEAFGGWKAAIESLAPEYRVQAGCLDPSECNVAILSRLPLIEVAPTQSTAIVAARLRFWTGSGYIPIGIVGVHLSRRQTAQTQREEWDYLVVVTESLGDAAVLAGDFNATPWSRSLRRLDELIDLDRRTHALSSWPTSVRIFTSVRLRMAPMFPIDHVYAGSRWRTVEVRRGPDIHSDHFPIIATFALEI